MNIDLSKLNFTKHEVDTLLIPLRQIENSIVSVERRREKSAGLLEANRDFGAKKWEMDRWRAEVAQCDAELSAWREEYADAVNGVVQALGGLADSATAKGAQADAEASSKRIDALSGLTAGETLAAQLLQRDLETMTGEEMVERHRVASNWQKAYIEAAAPNIIRKRQQDERAQLDAGVKIQRVVDGLKRGDLIALERLESPPSTVWAKEREAIFRVMMAVRSTTGSDATEKQQRLMASMI